ncbi:MAG: hypothetical protein AVDCRST_MAG22-1933, partial [uncultured Rubrobacteraceae bacterium]
GDHAPEDRRRRGREREELRVHEGSYAHQRARLVARRRTSPGRVRGQQGRLALPGLRRRRHRRARRPPLHRRHPEQARLGHRRRGRPPHRRPLPHSVGGAERV